MGLVDAAQEAGISCIEEVPRSRSTPCFWSWSLMLHAFAYPVCKAHSPSDEHVSPTSSVLGRHLSAGVWSYVQCSFKFFADSWLLGCIAAAAT